MADRGSLFPASVVTVLRRRSSGFTLVELMIVVAIVSILGSLEASRFIFYRNRAARTEVKANLAVLLKSERAHFAEHNTYTDDLGATAWQPEGKPTYIYGFTSDGVPASTGRNDTAEWCAAQSCGFSIARMVSLFGVPLTVADLPLAEATRLTFTVGAAGNLDNYDVLDTWTLDDAGRLTHVGGG